MRNESAVTLLPQWGRRQPRCFDPASKFFAAEKPGLGDRVFVIDSNHAAVRRRLTGFFSHSSDNVFGVPVVGGIPGNDPAVFADEDGRERVREGFVVTWGDANIEVLGNGREVLFGRRGEVPVEEFLVRIVTGIGATITAENLRRVVGRIEADGDEVGLFVERGIGSEGFVDVSEVAAHAGAEVGELAAGVDEGKEHDPALELTEMNGAVALIEEVEVGDGVARGGNVVLNGRFVVGASLGDDDDVVELDVGVICAICGCKNFGGDAIAGVELAENRGILEFVVHDHGLHKARNIFAVEGDAGGGGAEDFAADGEGLLRRG
jgi:hypothetical protein